MHTIGVDGLYVGYVESKSVSGRIRAPVVEMRQHARLGAEPDIQSAPIPRFVSGRLLYLTLNQ